VPDRSAHIDKARSNEALSLSLRATPYPDWAATVLFYAALHLVEAVLAPLTQLRTHVRRDNVVATDPRLRPIYVHYRELYDRSLDARYNCVAFTGQHVRNLHAQEYEPLNQHLGALLGI